MKRYLFPLILGIVGCAILINLGLWQLRRMEWKETMLARIEDRIAAPAVPLPETVDPSMKYMPVEVSGTTTGDEIDVLSGTKEQGGGYQIVSRFVTDDGRAILLDRGFVPQQDRHAERGPTRLSVRGNLHWPDEKAGSTPRRIWTRISGLPATCRPWPNIWTPNRSLSSPAPSRAMRRGSSRSPSRSRGFPTITCPTRCNGS